MSGFHPRDLINEVKIRPGLYDKDALEQPARKHKHQLWLEVAERLTPPEDWETFTDVEKEVRMGEIATKWKNLKDHFYREIKLEEAGDANKKRRYIYYDEMQFVRPFVGYKLPVIAQNRANREMRLNGSQEENGEEEDSKDIDDIVIDALLSGNDNPEEENETKFVYENNTPPPQPEVRAKSVRVIKPTPKVMQQTPKPSTSNSSSAPLNRRFTKEVRHAGGVPKGMGGVLRNSNFKIRDGDIAFCLSLVPTLRKLGDGRKLRAKIELLQTLHWHVEGMERGGDFPSRHNVSHNNYSSSHNDDNNASDDNIEEDMDADYLEEEYEEIVNVKQENQYDEANDNNSTGGGKKVWWT